MKFFQRTLTGPLTIDAQAGSLHRLTDHLDLREGSPKLLEHFAVERCEKLQDEQLSKRRKDRDLTPQDMDWPHVRRSLRHSKITAEHKSTFCQMVNQTVTTPAWLAEHGFEIDDRRSTCGGQENLAHWTQGCPDEPPMEDQELQAKLAGYTNDELTPVGMIPHTSFAYPPCDVMCCRRGVQVDKKDFSWNPKGDRCANTDRRATPRDQRSPQHGQQRCKSLQTAQSSMYCNLDHTLPRSAVVSEHTALFLAAMLATVPHSGGVG